MAGYDVHTHLLPAGIEALASDGKWGMKLGDGAVAVHCFKLQLAKMGRPETLIARLDADGLDGAVVAVPPPLFRPELEAAERPAYVRFLNDGLRAAVAATPRLKPLAYLPTHDPALALATAEDLDDGWHGVIVGTDLGPHSYADAAFHPLWRLLSDRALPVLVHPSESHDPRLVPFYLTNLLGNPSETALAAAQMLFGDLPSLFPDLKVVLSHGGGTTAALAGRWQRGVDTERPGLKPLGRGPRDAMRWFHVDTIVHSPAVFALLVETFGLDNILLGSDWPFPMGAPDADHDIGHMDDATRTKLRVANPRRVFSRL